MKPKLPSLPGGKKFAWACFAVAISLSGVLATPRQAKHAQAQEPPSDNTDAKSGAAATPAAQADPQGAADPLAAEKILRQAIATLESRQSVTAKVRQRIELFDRKLVGSGRYVQGPARSFRSRLELDLAVGSQQARWLQICDGNFLWTYSQMPDEEGKVKERLSRVDVSKVIEALSRDQGQPPSPLGFQAMGIGGLPQLLDAISRAFRFETVEPSRLGDLDMLILRGRWEPSVLASLVPAAIPAMEKGEAVDPSKLPEHLPDRVSLYLGKDDLFPYRIVYDRRMKNNVKPMITLELYEVAVNTAADSRQFIYNPATSAFHKATDQYLSRRGLTDK